MINNQHIIQKQVLELELPSEKGAFALQQTWSRHFQESLLPQISDLFDRMASEHTIIRLDKLEIDVGEVRLEELEVRLLSAMESELSRLVKEGGSTATTKATINQLSLKRTQVEAFGHFLETGTLPWWKMAATMPDLEQLITAILKKEESLSQIITKLRSVFFEKFAIAPTVIMNRLVAQFSDNFIQQFFAIIYEIPVSKITSWYKIKEPIASLGTTTTTLPTRKKRWQIVLKNISLNSTISAPQKKKIKACINSQLVDKEQVVSEQIDLKNVSLKEERKRSTQKEGLYIENAGLVLIAPYLSSFFRAVDLVEGKDFKSEPARHRAMHLLQYLANGAEQVPEYFMELNKILCQLPLDETIEKDIHLLQKEKTEAENLLNAVIKNWSALKNTSIVGLQETFLKRKGKLTFKEYNNSWLLQIEPKPFDVLLNYLPWTYSMIKLPWMQSMLRVEWT